MLEWIRHRFGKVIISVIIGGIALVFVFSGVFNPKATRGLHDASVAGTVNGEAVGIPEFNREYNRRIEMFRNMAGGKISDEQLKMFGIKKVVFRELAQRKLMVQEAERQGISASDEAIKSQIVSMPVFQKDGHFDVATYKAVLQGNNYSPWTFEKLIKEDLSTQHWNDFFSRQVHASDQEVQKEFLLNEDKRNVKYVLLTAESGRKGVQVSDSDVAAFLKDAGNLNKSKAQFEGQKETRYKGKSFEDSKTAVAREILSAEKVADVQKVNEKLAGQVAELLGTGKAGDAKVNELLKSYGVTVKETGLVSQLGVSFPGLGEAKEVARDAFSPKSPLADGKSKKYVLPAGTVVATVVGSQTADTAKLEKERPALIRQIAQRKERELFEDWMKKLTEKARIDINESVVGEATVGG